MKVFAPIIAALVLLACSVASKEIVSREIVDEIDPRIFEVEYELTPIRAKREARTEDDLEAFELTPEVEPANGGEAVEIDGTTLDEPLTRSKRSPLFSGGNRGNKKSYKLRRFRYQVGSYGHFPYH